MDGKNMKRVTIYSVAHEAGVSLATVSRVINGSPVVREDTRQKVQAAIAKLDYKPNAIAQGLALQKTTSIALVLPESSFNYTGKLINGLLNVAKIYKYNIILHTSTAGINEMNEIIENVIKSRMDGIIVYNDTLKSEELKNLKNYSIPIVYLGYCVEGHGGTGDPRRQRLCRSGEGNLRIHFGLSEARHRQYRFGGRPEESAGDGSSGKRDHESVQGIRQEVRKPDPDPVGLPYDLFVSAQVFLESQTRFSDCEPGYASRRNDEFVHGKRNESAGRHRDLLHDGFQVQRHRASAYLQSQHSHLRFRRGGDADHDEDAEQGSDFR